MNPFIGLGILCVVLFGVGMWMLFGTESYWRVQHFLKVKNVREAEPHDVALVWYQMVGIGAIILSIIIAFMGGRAFMDDRREAAAEELYGNTQLHVEALTSRTSGQGKAVQLGPAYFEATEARLDVLDGVLAAEDDASNAVVDAVADADLIVAIGTRSQWVSVTENRQEVVVTVWTRCNESATGEDDSCADELVPYDDPDDHARGNTLRLNLVELDAPLGGRDVVDGATGRKLRSYS